MLPIIPKPAISRRQKTAALVVAATVDLLQMPGFALVWEGALSPLEDGLDLLTAIVLIAICGFKWQFVVGFLVELLPVADMFPTWTAVVLMLPTQQPAQEAGKIHVEPVQTPEAPAQAPARTGPGVVDVDAVAVPPVHKP